MHPSLLPKYRGAAPIYHALLNGDSETGVTVLELSRNKFDAGKILKQVKVPIDPNIRYNQLADQLSELGAREVIATIADLKTLQSNAKKQDESQVSKAPKINREMGYIKWGEHTPEDVYRLWRTFGDTVGIHTKFEFNGTIVKLNTMENPNIKLSYNDIDRYESTFTPGMIKFDQAQELLFIKCARGWIGCKELQLENRLPLKALDFVNGYNIRKMKDPSTKCIHYQQQLVTA